MHTLSSSFFQKNFFPVLTCFVLLTPDKAFPGTPSQEIQTEEVKSTEKNIRNQASLTLLPNHRQGLKIQLEKDIREHSLLDNDGNEYITHWKVTDNQIDIFDEVTLSCDKKYREKQIFGKPNLILSYEQKHIRPTVFKPHTRCIGEAGFALVSSEGFIPDSYSLRIYRSHSNSDQYMPVGSSLSLKKKSVQYLKVFNDVVFCKHTTESNPENDIVDEQFSGFAHVSIESYFRAMHSCLKGLDYTLPNLAPPEN